MASNDVDEALQGRPILEALGLNTEELLEAACEKYKSSVDLHTLLPDDEFAEESVAQLLFSGIFHSDAVEEEDATPQMNEDQRIGLGEDKGNEIQKAFSRLFKESKGYNLSINGLIKLRAIRNEYRDVFRLRFSRDPPPFMEPMRTELK